MVSTASVLENIGVSAYVLLPSLLSLITMLFLQLLTSSPRNSYLGAAPLITTASNLVVAAEIVTVEARHSTFIRVASNAIAVPSAFDTPLGIRSVFSLAAGFISSCPSGSNLAVTPFAAITMTAPSATEAIVAGTTIQLQTVSFVLLFNSLILLSRGAQSLRSALLAVMNDKGIMTAGETALRIQARKLSYHIWY